MAAQIRSLTTVRDIDRRISSFRTPFVGREEELSRVVSLLSGRTQSVAMTGPPGIGLSRFLQEIRHRLERARVPVVFLTQSALRRSRFETAVPLRSPRTVIILDDAQNVDEELAGHLKDLMIEHRATVCLGMTEDRRLAPSLSAITQQGSCRKISLAPLDRSSSDALMAGLVGGRLDPMTVHRIWGLTTGRPRYLVELALGLLDDRSLIARLNQGEDLWQWQSPQQLPALFRDNVIAEKLGDLSPEEREAVDLISISGPIGPEILQSAGICPQALEQVEQRKILRVERSGRRLVLRLDDALLTLCVQQQLGHLRRRRLGRQLVGSWQGLSLRRQDDYARIAGVHITIGEMPPAQVAEKGARQAVAYGDYPLAERLARAALKSDPSLPALISLAESLTAQGNGAEAETTLRSAKTHGMDQPIVDLVRAINLRWGLSDLQGSYKIMNDLLRRDLPKSVHAVSQVTLAEFRLQDAAFRDALALVEPMLAAPPHRPRHRYRAMAVSISALAALGRDTDATELATTAAEELGADLIENQNALPEVVRHNTVGAIMRAHLIHGDFAVVEDLAQRVLNSYVNQAPNVVAAWGALRGEVALLRGQFGLAARLLDEAFLTLQDNGGQDFTSRMVRLLVLKTLAWVHLESGNPDEAQRVLGLLSPRDFRGLTALDLRTGPIGHLTSNAPSPYPFSINQVLESARRCRRATSWGVAVLALHQAVRLGGAGQLNSRMLEGIWVQGPLLQARLLHVRAAIKQDPEDLHSAALMFHELGAYPLAAEAATSSAQIFEASRRPGEAQRSLALAQASSELCDIAPTAVALWLREPTELTPRQREIARLAARRLSSRQIADQLVLSVRTVDNYLGQIYRKLNVSGRSQLAEAMGMSPVGAAEIPPKPPFGVL